MECISSHVPTYHTMWRHISTTDTSNSCLLLFPQLLAIMRIQLFSCYERDKCSLRAAQ